MNYKDITVGIVTFKSENVIFDCLKSIKYIKKIIIFDNSNDIRTKIKIKKKYSNIQIFLSKKNFGYGVANNKIIKRCKTKYLLILNPDTILSKNCEIELLKSIKKLKRNFSIISPISKDKNYGFFNKSKKNFYKDFIDVDYVKGFAMLINIKKIKKAGMFDKNIFLYLEEIDLCKRLIKSGEKIFVTTKAKINHIAANSTNIGFEFEKCRNWHWMWSKYYYNKKHFGYFYALKIVLPKIFFDFLKMTLFFPVNINKSISYKYRLFGSISGIFNLPSFFRPKLK